MLIEYDKGKEISGEVTKKTKISISIEKKCLEADETKEITVDGRGGRFEFVTQFTCLGSAVTFLIDNMVDVKCRIPKALKAISTLKTM